jgi:outer membrane protein insertion porin family
LGYFDDVRADVEKTKEGLVVTYIVREKPVVKRIVYDGNKAIKESDLQKVSELQPYTILNLNKVNEAAERIELLYKEMGYYNTKVSPEVKPISPTEVKVIFHIKEGEKVYIKKIAFEGNHAFSDDELKGVLEISEKTPISWFKKITRFVTGGGVEPGVYSYGTLYRDLGKIISFYQNHGYIDVRVGEPKVRQEGRWIYITIPIEEGPQYHIRHVDIVQDLFKHKGFLLKQLEIRKHEVFNREVLRRDIMKLTDIFADKGYAYASVEPEIKKDEKTHTVDIILKVDKGPLVYVNRIEITGNTRTRDKVIRREMLIVEQRPFSASRLKRSQDRIRRLGYFDDVNVSTEKGVREDQMDIKVKVKERPTGQFSIGSGYSSVDKLILMGQVSQNNLFGKGQVLSFQGIIGARTTRYSVTFVEPYFRDSRLSLTTTAYNWEREYDDYTRDSKGGGIKFGYLLSPNTRLFFGYRYDDSDLSDYTWDTSPIILESRKIKITSAVEVGIRRDTRNHFFDPTRGTTLNLAFEHAGGWLEGDAAFEKITTTGGIYFPVFWSIVGHVRTGFGYITEGRDGKLPVYEKFYLGGIDSVRGYRFGDISPKDPDTGDRIGGKYMFFVQNEAIFPLVKSMGLKGVLFLDLGNVWGKYQKWNIDDVRLSVGGGIRWLSPMGPLRIEWGYNLNRKSDEDPSNFNFRMGGQF